MSFAANIAVGVGALIHIRILILEMFLWEKPAGLSKELVTYQSNDVRT